MTGASKAPNALEELANEFRKRASQSDNQDVAMAYDICADKAMTASGKLAQHLSAAQAAAYEQAAQAAEEMNTVSASQADGLRDPRIVALDIAKEIRSLGSASALELALAQRELKEAAQALLDELDALERTGGECIPSLGAVEKLRARIAALSGQPQP